MPTAPPLPPHRGTSRRALLGASVTALGLGTATLAGCDDSRNHVAARPGVSGGSVAAAGDVDDDARLVRTVRQHLEEAAALVGSARSAFPVLAPPLRPLSRLHAGHLEELEAAGPEAAGPEASTTPEEPRATGRAGRDATMALAAVRRREQQLQHQLVEAAVAARSSRLARLLACMSAGTTQALVELPSTPPAGTGAA